jgi:hypothetical protein
MEDSDLAFFALELQALIGALSDVSSGLSDELSRLNVVLGDCDYPSRFYYLIRVCSEKATKLVELVY